MKKLSLLLIIGASWLLSCSKDAEPETKIDANSLELNYDKDHQFAILKGNENLSGSYNWASSDPTVGTVTTGGKFTARKIGSTVVSAKTNGREFLSYITVSPYSTMFREPIFELGRIGVQSKIITLALLKERQATLLFIPCIPIL